jgi:hypothetical protein
MISGFAKLRNSIAEFGLARGVEEPTVRIFNAERGQDVRLICAGVDADPVWPKLDGARDGMPVNDDETMVGLVVQKGLTDPAQVSLTLFFKFDSRTNPRMHE